VCELLHMQFNTILVPVATIENPKCSDFCNGKVTTVEFFTVSTGTNRQLQKYKKPRPPFVSCLLVSSGSATM
jgi:hypothetical protein